MNLRPIDNKVVVRPVEAESVTRGGIHLPDNAKKNRSASGVVLAVGPGLLLNDGGRAGPQLREGQTVWFNEWAGSEIEANGEKVRVLSETDVLAYVAEEGGA